MVYSGALEDLACQRAGMTPFSLLGLEGATLSQHATFIEALKRHATLETYRLPMFIEDCFNGNITAATIEQAFRLLCITEGQDEESVRQMVLDALLNTDANLALLDRDAFPTIGMKITLAGEHF